MTAVLLLLMRMGPADELDQSGALAGIWSNVTYLEARHNRPELEARIAPHTMEARNANHESY